MATIQKLTRKDGPKYRVMIRRKGHKAVTKVFATKKSAEEWSRKLEGNLDTVDAFPDAEARRRTLAQVIDGYMLERTGKDASIGGRLAWWKRQYGHLSLSRFTQSRVREGIRELAQDRTRKAPEAAETQTRGAATLNRHLAAVSAVMKWAVSEGWIATNPVRGIQRRTENPGRIRWLSDEERTALLTACDASQWADLGLLVRLALSTGARLGELLALRWSDLDLKKGQAYVGDSKSGEPRVLPLIKPVRELLAAKARPIDSGLIFRRDNDVARAFRFRRAWGTAHQSAGLDNFRFHDLRHSAASYLAMNGATLLEIADVLGHKTLVMVKRYSHLSTAHKTKLIERVMVGME